MQIHWASKYSLGELWIMGNSNMEVVRRVVLDGRLLKTEMPLIRTSLDKCARWAIYGGINSLHSQWNCSSGDHLVAGRN